MKNFLLLSMLVSALFAQTALALPPGETVNINTANAEALADAIDGVGITRAEAIIQYRDEHGNFTDVFELTNVRGIGERTVTLNQDRIRVK